MKKIIRSLIFLLFLSNALAFAQENFELDKNKILETPILLENPILLEETEIFEKPVIFEKNTEEKNDFEEIAPNGILSDKLTLEFDKGIIKEHKTELMTFYGFSENINKTNSNFKFDVLFLKLGLMGKLSSEKEKYVITANLTPNIHENFFKSLPLDSYIESSRFSHHKLKIGTFRPNLGYEGSMALFLIPLLSKSQIARNLSDARKTGLSLKGEYKYADYYIEGFDSTTKYSNFKDGAEANLWVDLKPLEKKKERFGNLKIGGGYQAGKRDSINYNVISSALQYDYKNLRLNCEYALSNGSNGADGLTDKKEKVII